MHCNEQTRVSDSEWEEKKLNIFSAYYFSNNIEPLQNSSYLKCVRLNLSEQFIAEIRCGLWRILT